MESRVGKSIKNTVFGMVGLLISQIFSFIARSIFINILGVEYNGVNGLFSNILQVWRNWALLRRLHMHSIDL